MEPASTPTTTLTEDVHQAALRDLPALVGEGRIHWGDDQRARHGADETEDLVFMPDVHHKIMYLMKKHNPLKKVLFWSRNT